MCRRGPTWCAAERSPGSPLPPSAFKMDSFTGVRLYFALSLTASLWLNIATAYSHNCDSHLVSDLLWWAFNSSSEFSSSHSPGYAKLNRRDGAGGWSPLESNKYQWLQMDLGERTEITAVATQGRYGSSDWVTRYLLMFSDTGRNWKQYRQEDSIWAFTGNSNADTVVQHKLQNSIKARFLRFIPLDWNPNGRIGMRVELYGCSYKSDVADFNGKSSIFYRFNQKSITTVKDAISLKFKTMRSDGMVLHGEGHQGDYITLELKKSKLSLEINLGDRTLQAGSEHTSIRLGSLLDDQHWHYVAVERNKKQVNFTVDADTQQIQTKGEFDFLDLDYELSIGGIPIPGKSMTSLRKNFHGCIENLYYNGVNIIDLAKRHKPQIYIVGNITFSCTEPHIVPVTFMTSISYLLLSGTPQKEELSLSFQFRTWNKDGLLLYSKLHKASGVVQIHLSDGKLRVTVHKSMNQADIITGVNLNDGQWHSIHLTTRQNRVSVLLNGEASSTSLTTQTLMYSGSRYYFGGCPGYIIDAECSNTIGPFQGCMRLFSIDDQPANLILVQQGLQGNFSDLQIDLCGIVDRCLPNYCEHGGECSQSWNSFYCDCTGTGYTGATCHNSRYKQSCESYKHTGNTSGFFSIDADGSGPQAPFLVYCNMTEDGTWTIIQHNSMRETRLQGSPNVDRPYIASFNYSASMKQLRTMISIMDHCEQEIAYHCKNSRLLNTPDGAPFTWWIGSSNEKQTYWGNSRPELQKCACGLEESCLDTKYQCNCDADRDEWTNDTGFLSHKDHLPVIQIVVGDINKTNSEAAFKLGPLWCHGDGNYWNAASFNTESSYLHFPTFHGELSADITFFFKTTASSGVFLENLGIKDFIRIELNSPMEVLFSFDVGNGPSEITVKSSTHLNNNQWHYVRVERNIKEASLQVDQLPRKIQEAPADGHIHLQLNSQLFVEVSALFEAGTSVTYNFHESYGMARNISTHLSAIYSDLTLSRENIAFSFRTTHVPSLLLYVDSYYQEHMAVVLCRNGSLQIRYKLDNDKGANIFSIDGRRLANGQLHSVKIDREGRDVSVQIDQFLALRFNLSSGTDAEFNGVKSLNLGKVTGNGGLDKVLRKANMWGFIGCLSTVQFNGIAPLKAALRLPSSAPIEVKGRLSKSRCGISGSTGSRTVTTVHPLADHTGTIEEGKLLTNVIRSDSAVIGGVIAVVIFVILSIVAVMGRLLYKHKGTYHTNETKRAEYAEPTDTTLKNNPNYQDTLSEDKKEYFI
ncbi:contactin-associated protein-like 5 isoform X13 [Narcine bancroftii]|uniref:contactin-associated protein-like 5 isoform X13 n=1 Tax=Narcine bancroftii TaxID=1343680 RepID=UPI0038319C5A